MKSGCEQLDREHGALLDRVGLLLEGVGEEQLDLEQMLSVLADLERLFCDHVDYEEMVLIYAELDSGHFFGRHDHLLSHFNRVREASSRRLMQQRFTQLLELMRRVVVQEMSWLNRHAEALAIAGLEVQMLPETRRYSIEERYH